MGSIFNRRQYKPRKDGKKITSWHLDVDGRRVEVEVRMLKGPKFWVDLPEYKIDLKDTDIEVLKTRTIDALREISPIQWEDVLVLEFTCADKDDFPTVSTDTLQNGIDKDGQKYHRNGPGRSPSTGHAITGNGHNSWRSQHGFQIVVSKTKENEAFVKALRKTAGKVICDLATLAGLTFNKSDFSNYKLKDAAALKKFIERGVEIEVKLGKKK